MSSNINHYAAMSFPALEGGVVTQGHANYCAEHGHATHTFDGKVQPYCPRCGDVSHPEAFPTREEMAALMQRIEVEEAAERAELAAEDAAYLASEAQDVITAVLADAYEVASTSSSQEVKAEFRTSEIAAERAAQLAPVVESVRICPNPSWIAFTR